MSTPKSVVLEQIKRSEQRDRKRVQTTDLEHGLNWISLPVPVSGLWGARAVVEDDHLLVNRDRIAYAGDPDRAKWIHEAVNKYWPGVSKWAWAVAHEPGVHWRRFEIWNAAGQHRAIWVGASAGRDGMVDTGYVFLAAYVEEAAPRAEPEKDGKP